MLFNKRYKLFYAALCFVIIIMWRRAGDGHTNVELNIYNLFTALPFMWGLLRLTPNNYETVYTKNYNLMTKWK